MGTSLNFLWKCLDKYILLGKQLFEQKFTATEKICLSDAFWRLRTLSLMVLPDYAEILIELNV